jgi:hypothetical protein
MHRVKHLFVLPVRWQSTFSPKFNPWHDYRAYLDQVKVYINRLNPYIEIDLRSAALNWDFILNAENSLKIAQNIKQRKENEYADIEHIVRKISFLTFSNIFSI